MGIVFHDAFEQGSEHWLRARLGILTASTMCRILTGKTLKCAANDTSRAHVSELLAQRITGHAEPQYVSDAMLRGQDDEIRARAAYSATYAPVSETGFITNDRFGFTIGYSPDGLVGDDGLIECKSRYQRFQVETIISGVVPDEYMIQIQTGLLVSEREYCDFISYSGGLPMVTLRVFPDPDIQAAIVAAATTFEATVTAALGSYADRLASGMRLIPTERVVEQEMF